MNMGTLFLINYEIMLIGLFHFYVTSQTCQENFLDVLLGQGYIGILKTFVK
jgi:hypothetical protein